MVVSCIGQTQRARRKITSIATKLFTTCAIDPKPSVLGIASLSMRSHANVLFTDHHYPFFITSTTIKRPCSYDHQQQQNNVVIIIIIIAISVLKPDTLHGKSKAQLSGVEAGVFSCATTAAMCWKQTWRPSPRAVGRLLLDTGSFFRSLMG